MRARSISSTWQQAAQWGQRAMLLKITLRTPYCCAIGVRNGNFPPLKGVRNPRAMHSNNC